MRLGYEDAVLNLQGPIATQGAEEFPAALAELRGELELGAGPLGLVGGSMGSAVAQLVLTETGPRAGIAVRAAVLISPIVQLRAAVEATGRRFGVTYPWGPASRAVADRLDFLARAGDLLSAGQPALQLIVGAHDDQDFLDPAQRLEAALADRYDEPTRVGLVVVPDMAHALTDEPGVAPAPQNPHAATVDHHAVDWLRHHLEPADNALAP